LGVKSIFLGGKLNLFGGGGSEKSYQNLNKKKAILIDIIEIIKNKIFIFDSFFF
jgi:hypothetical protein